MRERLVLVADETTARIFACKGNPPVLEALETLDNPQGRLKDRDIGTDKGGRMYDEGKPNRSAYQANLSPTEVVLQKFLRDVAHSIERRAHSNPIELVLIGGPKIRGHLRKDLGQNKSVSISIEINKDLSELREKEIATYIDPLQFEDRKW